MKIYKFNLLFLICLAVYHIGQAQENIYKNYSIKDGLPSLNVKSITQDSIGYLWITSDKGLVRFDGNSFTTFSAKNGLTSNKINCLALQNDSLLIGTDKGLSIKVRNKFLNFKGKEINAIFVHKTIAYLSTIEGVYLLKKDQIRPLKVNLQIDFSIIKSIVFHQNFYWIATNKALWKVDDLQKPNLIKKIEGGNFTSMLSDSNKLIAATLDGEIKILKKEGLRTITTSMQEINSIAKIDNNYWISSIDQGIEVLNSDFSFQRKINKYNALATDRINFVFSDNQQNKWIATKDKGVYVLNSNIKKLEEPTIHFENIEVIYQPLDSININSYKKKLQLKSSKNHISFSYKTIDISNPKNVLYRYKLNNDFTPWSNKNTVDFPNLSPGNYQFVAQSKIGTIESKPIRFSFYIDTPIYQKLWFQMSLLGLSILIISGFIYNYIKRLKAKNKASLEKLKLENNLLALEQKALQLQMNPHFVFNVLNGIKALGNTGKSAELNTTINKFAGLLRSVLNNSRLEEVSLADEISTLKNYIELEQQMSTLPFDYSIKNDTNIDIEEILIPPMLLQPFVENSIKHGISSINNGKIDIHFSIKDDFLRCSISDNGIGLTQTRKTSISNKHQSVAIKVTEERIKNLSKESTFSIKELKGKDKIIGTRVWFKIPLKTDF